MCFVCNQQRVTATYGIDAAFVLNKVHYQEAIAGFVPDGVGGDLKLPVFRPLLVATTDDVPGDVTTSATLTVGAPSVVSTIDTIGDLDFYKVELVAGQVYDIGLYGKLGGPGGLPLADSFLELYDAEGNLVTSADGGADTPLNTVNSGFDVLLTYVAERTGTYYVNARAFDNLPEDGTNDDLVGDYELFVQDVTDQPRYVPYYDADSPLYALDWGSEVDGTVRNPDGAQSGHLTGNPAGTPDTKGVDVTGKNVITIYFAKPGDIFVSEDPTQPSLPPATVAVGARDYEVEAVWAALREFEKVADVVYVDTQDRAAADFEYFTYTGTPGPGVSLLGSMSPPNELDEGLALFNSNDQRWNELNLQQGGFSFVTLIHEFGHGHGMAHPHDNGGRSGIMRGVTSDGPVADYTTGDFALNQGVFTMMSYEDGWQSSLYGNAPTDVGYGYLGGLMALDIAVIQDKYGVNEEWARGNDTYVLKDENAPGTFFSSIWDTGGRDTISYAGARDATIDLRAATLQYEVGGGGRVSYAEGVFGGFTIANGVVIENATGGSGNDVLFGNAANNRLSGGAGDDVLAGGLGDDYLAGSKGRDTASYADAGAGVTVSLAVAEAQNTGGAGRDQLSGIENLAGSAFDDVLTGDAARNVLTGGAGIDVLTGGAGGDLFVFAEGDTGTKRQTADRIADFSRAERDRIDMSAIDARDGGADDAVDEAFAFVGTAAFSGTAGELRVEVAARGFTLFGDTNGDGLADLVIRGTGDVPTARDLVL